MLLVGMIMSMITVWRKKVSSYATLVVLVLALMVLNIWVGREEPAYL